VLQSLVLVIVLSAIYQIFQILKAHQPVKVINIKMLVPVSRHLSLGYLKRLP
jgi:hypothetical protein